jgi:4-amino-4-deoxy-L-arabinose transferase-like glycosyltransferase
MAHLGGQVRWFLRFKARCRLDPTVVTDCTYKIRSVVDDGQLRLLRKAAWPLTQKGESPVFQPRLTEMQSRTGFAVLLAMLAFQLAWTAKGTSITWDEDDHIYAGYMSLKHGDFGLNPEHPPLVKQLAAVPLLPMTLKMPALENREFKHEAFLGGQDFIFRNDAEAILFRARMAAALLTLLLAALMFFAAREMFGTGAALIALALFVFDPNVLAHGAVVGTDMGLSCFMFATIYGFYRYVKAPTVGRLIWVGVASGLTFASKHTGILLIPMLLLLSLTEVFRKNEVENEGELTWKRAQRFAIAFVVISAIALATLWAAYGFRYAARGDGLQMNPPLAESIHHLSRPREVWLLEMVARCRLLPESYIFGLSDVRIMSDYYTSYLFGRIYPHGTWFYFPAAFAIKSTLPLLFLLGLAIGIIATGRLHRWREVLFLTIPPAVHLVVAMSAGMNIGLRHVLPMYPFLYVLAGGAAWVMVESSRRWVYVVAAMILFQGITTTRIFPAYMAYANELWGGPSQTYKHLSDSNVDWGQQLKSTKSYLERKGIKDCWFIYFAEGPVRMTDYGIPCKPLVTIGTLWLDEELDVPPSVNGPVLISAGTLSGFEFGPGPLNPYEVFKHQQPTGVIDYGVFVFNGHYDIPLAASYSHAQKAQMLLRNKRPEEALAEAQQSLVLAPDAVKPNVLLGDVLVALKRPDEARPYYEKALMLAKSVEPEFQLGWVPTLQEKLNIK